MFDQDAKRGEKVTGNPFSLGPVGQGLPYISGFPFAQPPDLPGIPLVRASIILIGRLERELAFCEAFKDSLCCHLSFQLYKNMEEKIMSE